MQISREFLILPFVSAAVLMMSMQNARRDLLGFGTAVDFNDDKQGWSAQSILSVVTLSPTTDTPSTSPVGSQRSHSPTTPDPSSEDLDILTQRLTKSQYEEMKEEKSCPYYTKFGYRGCSLGCSCRSVFEACYPKYGILDFGKDSNKEVDIGVCWPATSVLCASALVIFFMVLACVVGVRKCAIDYTYYQLEKIHAQVEAESQFDIKSGTVQISGTETSDPLKKQQQ
eukprot:gnl/MRDRNA2_/MRDRNA2_146016_c0_seq1.p1 gnl/MRDRNA2_/MRDRNA2_146016_c0~~gnl/MRDRNA2_/MRDRNA2_146016_c0_seq1.p1  ORF type:complete len:227 (-),score=36.26 gnl/MRDRNA2_/MRDRNA2_146016_c0_seq1:25-705(-)